MAKPIIVRMKFDRKEGDNYYFLCGFYNEGMDLPQFGDGAFPSPHSLLNLLSALPYVLNEGTWVEAYQVPERIILRSAHGKPHAKPFSIVEDLLSGWQDLLGYVFLNFYEVLYTPEPDDVLPQPYLDAYGDALPATPGGNWTLPLSELLWPADETEFTVVPAAHSVSLEGCQLVPEYAHIWTGSIDPKWHMLSLISGAPILPEEENIFVRWWDSHAASGMKRSFGAFDARYPQYDFLGWREPGSGSPQNGRIRILEGLAEDYELPIVTDDDVIIAYLSPTKAGAAVSVKVPFSKDTGGDPEYGNDAFFFPDAPGDDEPITTFPDISMLLAVSLPLLSKSINVVKWFSRIRLSVAIDRHFGFAGDTEPFAGHEKALVTTHD